jgi:deoxyribodipyrimidine photo-lyase
VSKPLNAALVWFRRDLRVDDHAALCHALKSARRVYGVFVFDRAILDPLLERGLRADRRVEFIRESVADLQRELASLGSGLIVRHAWAASDIPAVARELQVQAVFANHDDEPGSLERDAAVQDALARDGIGWHTFKDHVIFERNEILTGAATPYGVFTPYKNAWLKKVDPFYLAPYPVRRHAGALAAPAAALLQPLPTLGRLGFAATNLSALGVTPGATGARRGFDDFLGRIDRYDTARNFPAVKGPSYLSVHLRFGTISIREAAREAWQRARAGSTGAAAWLGELIWRDFYHQVLHHHPHVVGHAFKAAFDGIEWEVGPQADSAFAAWCEGRTGYPLVDAAMAQINQTGYMHNRLRMLSASFLTKDLGIDWRRGEQYFADHLIDFDLAANNGGWQWTASTGCDAQPWFRIFNPVTQSEKFDPQGRFIRRYVPPLAGLSDRQIHAPWTAGAALDYPAPIVRHEEARERTLRRYGKRASGSDRKP